MLCITLLGATAAVSCTTKHYKKSADKEAAAIIAQKTPLVPNMDTNFTVLPAERLALDQFPVFGKTEPFFGEEAQIEVQARVINLLQALDLAVKHSRNYQTRKETLFLQALGLSLDRHEFAPLFSGRGSTERNRSAREVSGGVDRIVETQTYTGTQTAGVRALTRIGTRLATSFSTDFLRFITGDPRLTTSSALVGTLTQPLLRGAGARIATENLTQSERDFLYSLREFTRYRKEFSVDIASSYFNVLQNRDTVHNSYRGYRNFQENVTREEAFANEELRSQGQLDQLKQALLSTESRWINAIRSYRQSLDQFKIQLGLPVEANIILADAELEQLEIVEPSLTLEQAMEIAMVSRLDLETDRDRLIDSERHIKVAANTFLPQLDAVGRAGVNGTAQGNFATPGWDRYSWSAGLELDLPFDRKAQRNNYRAAFIAFERAKRELDLSVDSIRLQIMDDWRNLDQARRSHEISQMGVEIAQRRVEEQTLRQELDRGSARDLVDAENDLIDSKNQRTSALVNHTIARLRFWRDIGILTIKDNGQWNEVLEPEIIEENEFSDN